MGSVVIPTTGLVYVDANVVIYTVDLARCGSAEIAVVSSAISGRDSRGNGREPPSHLPAHQ
ncbi:MAG TPA: hypothetical protein VMM76_11900 [Pirellulaceae bacterium]|nr:hypothetical protein [Pirellulaceae bacterium]